MELIRAPSSRIPSGLGPSRNDLNALRASGFFVGVTESSRSYVTWSTVSPLDFSRNLEEDAGTEMRVSHLGLSEVF